MIRVERWKRRRAYAVYENEALLAVAVYKKGALAVAARLGELLDRTADLERAVRATRPPRPIEFPRRRAA